MDKTQYFGPTTTASSSNEGRLKVDAGKRKTIKNAVKKYTGKGGCDGKGGIMDGIFSGIKKLKNIGKSVSSAVSKGTNPIPPPGAMYEWDDKSRSWVGNEKYRTMMKKIEKSKINKKSQ
jgi:hypothetical protein